MKTLTKGQIQREELLLSLGFKKVDSWFGKWQHKMFEDRFFDFTEKDPDLFWTMHTIFETCASAGRTRQNNDIKDLLNLNL